jgi:phenylalanyl-tRNA synthetase beta chain
MLVSEFWLKEWVDTDLEATELEHRLTLAGLEVESIAPATDLDFRGSNRARVVLGRIIAVEPHPQADRLKICAVDIGKPKTLQVVCGAPNVSVGLVAPVALVGAKLPGLKIKQSEIRGIRSKGMLCSAFELGLSDQASGLMELDPDATPGAQLFDYLGLDDTIFEIDLTPNRGDCLCIQGIAREISALTGAAMKDTRVKEVKAGNAESLPIQLKAPEACSRFAGRAVLGIDMQANTPDWMKEKLRRSGLRSINPVVDITNYVMFETGQPMHAYDLDKLSGGITVRNAGRKETLKLLDGSTVTLSPDHLVIADQSKAVGLAGIMGGEVTAISESTRNIFFEAAFFSTTGIIGKARQFGMHTDASHRFERGVNPNGQVAAVQRATALLLEIAGGEPGKVCHTVNRKYLPKVHTIKFEKTEIPRLLGVKVPAKHVHSILKRLGMGVSNFKDGWKVKIPSWRFDLTGQHDLVEEIGRCYGYDRVMPRMPVSAARTGGYPETRISLSQIKKSMTCRGYYEAINYSFIDAAVQVNLMECKKGVTLENPLADNMTEMRQSLFPGLLSTLARNLNHQQSRVQLFECGNVFHRRGKSRIEIPRIAALTSGLALPRQWGAEAREVDFFDLKGDLENLLEIVGADSGFKFHSAAHPAFHPGQSAAIRRGRKTAGYLGQLHPVKQKSLGIDQKVFLFELDLDALSVAGLPSFEPISRFPQIQRDLAVVVDKEVPAVEILSVVNRSAGEHLKKLELFDIYTGEGIENNKKSFAFSLTFQSESSSLKAGEIEAVIDNIINALRKTAGAELRS